jgi:hypothetical protein
MSRFTKQAEKTPPRDDMSRIKLLLKSVGYGSKEVSKS